MNSSKSYKKYLLFTVIWGVHFMILKSLRSERSRSLPLSVLELCSKASAAQRPATAILFSRPRGRCCWPRRSETTTNNFPIIFNQVAGSRFTKNPWHQEDPETSKETDLVSDFSLMAEGPISATQSPLVSGKGVLGRESFPSPPFCDNKERKTDPRLVCCQAGHREIVKLGTAVSLRVVSLLTETAKPY